MHRGRHRIPRLTLTLAQMMKLVLFAAVACGSVAPMVQLKERGVVHDWTAVIVWAAVAAPLSCAITAFVAIRRGPFRDWLIRMFLLASVASALGFALYLAGCQIFLVLFQGRWLYGFSYLETTTAIIVLGLAFVVLLRRAVRGWRPASG
jgi:hypothetical protein